MTSRRKSHPTVPKFKGPRDSPSNAASRISLDQFSSIDVAPSFEFQYVFMISTKGLFSISMSVLGLLFDVLDLDPIAYSVLKVFDLFEYFPER